MRRLRVPAAAALAAALLLTHAGADAPRDARGYAGLALMLRKLDTVGTVMFATAHPDDEHNSLIARLAHGDGLRVVLVTATRGSGGQNEIGPELFMALGVLRTEELLSAHRHDGAEQFFGRAVDFGYSFSVEETFERWGRDEILGDFVRLMRATRPDVVITMRPSGTGGGQHHQASAILAAEAFEASADPRRYPELAGTGSRPWKPARLFHLTRYGFRGEPQREPTSSDLVVPVDVHDALLGRTYAEIGSEGRAMHKSQGFGQLLALPGTLPVVLSRDDSGPASAGGSSVHAGLDLSLAGLDRRFTRGRSVPPLLGALNGIAGRIRDASRALQTSGPEAAAGPLAGGLGETRVLRERLSSLDLDETAQAEIDFRLARTERKFEDALRLAQGLRLEALADDGVVTPGQSVRVSLIVANRGTEPVSVGDIALEGFDSVNAGCERRSLVAAGVMQCAADARIPADARTTEPYWRKVEHAERYAFDADAPFGLPFRPTPFVARVPLVIAGQPVEAAVPVVHRYEGNIFSGEKRMELQVVPPITVRIAPEIAIVPADGDGSDAAERDVRVTVANHGVDAPRVQVRLMAPPGWSSAPASESVELSRAGEATTVRFALRPPAGARPGRYEIRAVVESERREYRRGFQIIEYPHTRRQHLFRDATAVVQVIDVAVPDGLRVGYVMGVGDQVPPAIEQIGAEVTMLGSDALAWGDLSGFDAIVTGVRAYERRQDLRAYNQRLLQYAADGGVVIVQYNKFEFNQAQYGPYPAQVSANRVTDETSPVVLLEPAHPVFNAPNAITSRAWDNWTQERGLYFLGDRDERYTDLVELRDPFEYNPGPKRGALVEARVGRGRWIYVGLGLWRQLPAGTEGAYQLLANLISLRRTAPAE